MCLVGTLSNAFVNPDLIHDAFVNLDVIDDAFVTNRGGFAMVLVDGCLRKHKWVLTNTNSISTYLVMGSVINCC